MRCYVFFAPLTAPVASGLMTTSKSLKCLRVPRRTLTALNVNCLVAIRYRKAANKGFANAQFNLGVMHHKGEGVLQDSVEAEAWYRKAATQSHAEAQFHLAVMHHHGPSVCCACTTRSTQTYL